jgi:hypothetical protein
MGIYCLEDLLDREPIEQLFQLFMASSRRLNIIDDYDPETIPEKDRNKLNEYTLNYWIRIRKEKSLRLF